MSYPTRGFGFGDINLVGSPLEAGMFAGVVNVFVAIAFSPRLVTDFLPYRLEQRALMDAAETGWLWRNLDGKACRCW